MRNAFSLLCDCELLAGSSTPSNSAFDIERTESTRMGVTATVQGSVDIEDQDQHVKVQLQKYSNRG